MRTLMITYDLRAPGRNYGLLHDAIKKLSSGRWVHPLESVWIVQTFESASYWRDQLKHYIDSNDRLLVVQTPLSEWASWNVASNEVEWMKRVA